MEGHSCLGGARPKTSPTGRNLDVFEALLTDIKGLLLEDEIQMLATALEFKPAEVDTLERSEDPVHLFVHLLKRKGIIKRMDISALSDKLKICGRHGVADDVNAVFQRYLSQTKPPSVESQTHNEKKAQFVTELRNKYKNMCGDIPPAPFLRDRYRIDELYVESGIEFMEGKHIERNGQEKWKKLKDYKTVFTDPQVKSKRRVIVGEPGCGKSILALQIAHDWCQGITPVNDFEIVILLRLRQFKSVPTVFSAIKRFLLPKDSKLTEYDIESILDSSSTLIVLDGYDEYPKRGNEDTDVEHIIREDMFQKHEVILTTRMSCLPPRTSSDTKKIRLTGFDDATRDAYVRNVVARGCPDVADKISSFFKVNLISADLCKIPLFFTMISYMVTFSEKFRNLWTVTHFFEHIIECFRSHKKLKATEQSLEEELDYSRLCIVAFEGLISDNPQISWDKYNLIDEIGHDLYDDCVSTGILIEEECYDHETIKYFTETRFFHKMFAEWYAAHYLAAILGAQHAVKYDTSETTESDMADTSKPQSVPSGKKSYSLKNLDPNDLQYLYRFACGLNSDAAVPLITYLGKNEYYDTCTLLCIAEWGGDLETIIDTVTLLCHREIYFDIGDSCLWQRSATELIKFACSRMIPIRSVFLEDCVDVGACGTIYIRPSGLPLPLISTSLNELTFYREDRRITEEETSSILQYTTKCPRLKELSFWFCEPPPCFKVNESLSVLSSRGVEVGWNNTGEFGKYHLNLESGQWKFESPKMLELSDTEIFLQISALSRVFGLPWKESNE